MFDPVMDSPSKLRAIDALWAWFLASMTRFRDTEMSWSDWSRFWKEASFHSPIRNTTTSEMVQASMIFYSISHLCC